MAQQEQAPKSGSRVKALFVIVLTIIVGIGFIALVTLWVIGSAPRTQAVSLIEGQSVSEYITLPDDDAYPASLAIGLDRTLYTGSYKSGAIWTISPQGVIAELAGARDKIGSVSALDVAPDGSLVILDRIVPLDTEGAVLWRYRDGELSVIVELPKDENYGVILPDDIAVDASGQIYVSDRGPDRVWRFTPDGVNEGIWWTDALAGQNNVATTGLAYNAKNDSLLITDSERDIIYQVPVSAADMNESTSATTQLFMRDPQLAAIGLDGISASNEGVIYVAELSANKVARLEDGKLIDLAQDFRGSSDVAYDAGNDRLFVTNWNQFSLGFGTRPQLPFALDAIYFSPTVTPTPQ